MAAKDIEKDGVIDRGEELPDVALEYPAGARVVLGDLAGERCEAIHCSMRALPFPAGEGVGNECTIEKRVQLPIQRMVHQSVSYQCFVDVAGLRIGDLESAVAAMTIGIVL